MTSNAASDPEELVQRWFDDLFSRGRLDVADDILAADVDYHGPPSLTPRTVRGPADIKEYVEVYRRAFPDLQYRVESLSRAGESVCVRWSATGTHRSDLFGIEPSGEVFTVDGIDIFVVEDGRIAEVHAQWDTLRMVQELGVVPSLGTASVE
jgi:steroid delta-isomerase-like uncharacterized protein